MGKVGEYLARLVWGPLGKARDRLWRLRFSANAPFTIINADAQTEPGDD